MRPAEGLEKPRLYLQGVSPCWLAHKQGRKSLALEAASSPHFPIQTGKHPSLLIPHHSPEGDQGKDLVQLQRDGQGHLEWIQVGSWRPWLAHTRGQRVGRGDTVGVHTRQAAPQKWPSAESQALGEDSVQLLRDDPEGLGCEQGGAEPTVHARGQGGSESRCGRHRPRAHHRAPRGCAGAPCRQALAVHSNPLPGRAPWRHPLHATAWCWAWGRQVPGEVCGGQP